MGSFLFGVREEIRAEVKEEKWEMLLQTNVLQILNKMNQTTQCSVGDCIAQGISNGIQSF